MPTLIEGSVQEDIMAKEQRRGNRETKKPKKKQEPATAPVGLMTKGLSASIGVPSKKK
jgi:hypothetical protein